jgi:hypothetical protein
VEYQKMFLEEMVKYEPYMASYEEEIIDKILPNLQNDEKEHILVIYNKCIFYSNDSNVRYRQK